MPENTEYLYKLFLKYPVICTDTRNIKENCIFFSLKGNNFNGNSFARQALDLGAAYAIIDEKKYNTDKRCILVRNSLTALQNLAKYHRQQMKTRIIGITGTNGKTTTKELIKNILSRKYNVTATSGNLNNHIGVPLTILSVDKNTEFAIVEMGASHAGEIKKLCSIAMPHFGIITNIGNAHIEGFKSFEGVIKAKNELYRFIYKNKGIVFVNNDNPILTKLSKNLNKITYGCSADAGLYGEMMEANPFVKLRVCRNKKESVIIKSNLIGSYNLENILAAACVGKYFRVNIKDIKSSVEKYIPQNNRSQFLKTSANRIIMDAYNANPTSMNAAIINFHQLDFPGKILIAGDMLELGKESINEHKKILSLIKKCNFEEVFLVGEWFSKIRQQSNYKTFHTSEEIMKWINKNPVTGKTILIKGSRGIMLEKILKVL